MSRRSVIPLLMLLSALPGAAMLDQDGGGISDFWQQLHPGLDPAADTDGDGFDNASEAVAGTDPLDKDSRLKIDGLERMGESAVFHWSGVVGKAYTIERFDPATGEWSAVETEVASSAGPRTLAVPAAETAGIFRLRVADHDGDGDGLNAWEEGLLGFSDDSSRSSGQGNRQDFSAGLRFLEGSGTALLADGTPIPRRPPVREEVVRFLVQASFGGDPDLIDHVMTVGIGGWMDEQLEPAVTTLTNVVMYNNGPLNASTFPQFWSRGWWRAAMTSSDQLRLRMGNALSQILVISAAGNDVIRQNSFVQADYYDILLTHSLGNYRNLLEDVSYSTQMGFYLSHLKNRKSDPSIGRFPDENFAREIMQLFTIGLWELNPDGSRKLDEEGNAIPTYDNTTIMEMAKVFTGFGFGGPTGTSFFATANATAYVHPMKMWDSEHEPGEKHIIGDVVIPAGQTGEEDIDDALDALCAHPNIAPFISRLLIQRFTCSNPTPDYLRRVAAVWDNNGSGERGDLKAVLEAILMDPEARTPKANGDASGMVREPYLRLVALMRAFKARNTHNPPIFPVWIGEFPKIFGQQPLWAPSVFNFYLPDHQPAGELRERGLVSPELEIASADRLINGDNFLQRVIDRGMDPFTMPAADVLVCDFSTPQALSSDAAALVDYLDSLLTWGELSPSTRQAVIIAVQAQATAELKVETAVHLIVESPDFVVLK
jgi:uncharacterized protein (DUF1800 family)